MERLWRIVPALVVAGALLGSACERNGDVLMFVRLPDYSPPFDRSDPFKCVNSLRVTVRSGIPGGANDILTERFYPLDARSFELKGLKGGRDRFVVLEGCRVALAALEAGAPCAPVSRGSSPPADFLAAGQTDPNGRRYDDIWLFFGRIGEFAPLESRTARGHAFSAAIDLENGKFALVAGLSSTAATMSQIDVFEVAGYEFKRPGSLAQPRAFAAGARLSDGGALIAGGTSSVTAAGAALSSVERIDRNGLPVILDPPAQLSVGRVFASAAPVMVNGKERLIVSGGAKTFDVKDPDSATEVWNGQSLPYYASMILPRTHHTVTALGDGRVLIAGGYALRPAGPISVPEISDSGELLDSSEPNPFDAIPGMKPRWGHAATLLDDGTVLVTGGSGELPDPGDPLGFAPALVTTCDIFLPGITPIDPSPKWKTNFAPPILKYPRAHHAQALLPSGAILVTGGTSYAGTVPPVGTAMVSSEIVYPTGIVTSAGDMHVARVGHVAFALPDGTVLVAGGLGTDGGGQELAEIYTPRWEPNETSECNE